MEETTRRRRSHRFWRTLSAGLIVILMIAGAVYFWLRPRLSRVIITTVHQQTIANKVFASGDVHPTERQVVLQNELQSPVSKVYVKLGEQVHKGELLLSCSNTSQSAQLSAAKTEVQQAQTAYNQTEAQASAAPASLRSQFAGTLASLKASLSQAKAGLAAAQEAYDQTQIRAQINGMVLSLNPDGIAPNGSSAPIIELVGSKKQVVLSVSEVDAVHLHAGLKATVDSDAFPNKTWNAVVKEVALFASTSSNGAGQVEVDLSLPADCPIPFGYQVNVHITSQTHKNALTVPYSALTQSGSQYVVYTLSGSRVTEVPVKLGITTNTTVEVTSGLKTGETVVLNPPQTLQSGQRVVVIGHD